MLDTIMSEVNKELDELSVTDLQSYYFDRRVDELKQEFNTYLDREKIDMLRDIQKRLNERKESINSPTHITYLFNLYELFNEEAWKLLGKRETD